MMQRGKTGGKKASDVVKSGCRMEVRAMWVQKPLNEWKCAWWRKTHLSSLSGSGVRSSGLKLIEGQRQG